MHIPWLFCQGIDDLDLILRGALEHSLDIIHIDGQVRNRCARAAFGSDTDLDGSCPGAKRDDPALIHQDVEVKESTVKGRDLFGITCRKIRNNATDLYHPKSGSDIASPPQPKDERGTHHQQVECQRAGKTE